MSDFEARMAALLDILQQCAASGARCPVSDALDRELEKRGLARMNREAFQELRRRGLIKIEISGKNWRVVEILAGPYAGKRTMEDPTGAKPYRVLTKYRDQYLTPDGRIVRRRA